MIQNAIHRRVHDPNTIEALPRSQVFYSLFRTVLISDAIFEYPPFV